VETSRRTVEHSCQRLGDGSVPRADRVGATRSVWRTSPRASCACRTSAGRGTTPPHRRAGVADELATELAEVVADGAGLVGGCDEPV
jgi:hypothetical protein